MKLGDTYYTVPLARNPMHLRPTSDYKEDIFNILKKYSIVLRHREEGAEHELPLEMKSWIADMLCSKHSDFNFPDDLIKLLEDNEFEITIGPYLL